MTFLETLKHIFFKRTQTQPNANPSAKIVVLGNTGVGKTQFIHSLIEDLRYVRAKGATQIAEAYQAFLEDSPIVLMDTVGGDIPNTYLLLEEMLHKNEVEGIINVVSYGYIGEQGRINLKDAIDETGQVSPHFLALARQKDIAYLNQWLPLLTPHTQIGWIITLINQMDIWYPEKGEVMYYYESPSEEYQKKFNALKKTPCKHYIIPYSAILELYLDKFPSKIGISQQQQIQQTFFRTLLNLVENGSPL